MKTLAKTLLLGGVVQLAACEPAGTGNSVSSASSSSRVTSSVSSQTASSRPLSIEGEFCGGIAAFQCAPGLTCKYDGTYPDAGGTCVKP